MTDALKAMQNADREEFRPVALEMMVPEMFSRLPEYLALEQAEEVAELAVAQTTIWPESAEVFWALVSDFYSDTEPGDVAEYGLEESISAMQEGETLADDEKSALSWLYILDNYPDLSTYSILGRMVADAPDEQHEDDLRELAEHAIECVAVARYPELLGELPLFLREE